MNPDGSDRRRLTYTSDADGWLDVSPDGKKLVIAGSVSFLQGHLYTMNVDGTNRRLLVSLTNSVVADPAWSPDGRTIAYVAGAETPNVVAIWTVAASGGKVTRLSQATQSAAWPSWSPDGAKIVYVGYTPGTSDRDLYTMNADGSAPQLLHDCIEICVNPVWSADGRRVVYATVSGGVAQVQYCVVQLAVPTCGIPLATDVSTLTFDLSPDGSQLVFKSQAVENNASVHRVATANVNGSAQTLVTGDLKSVYHMAWGR